MSQRRCIVWILVWGGLLYAVASAPAVVTLTEHTETDAVTGRDYTAIGGDDFNTSHMYFTQNGWSSDGRYVVLNTNFSTSNDWSEIVKYDTDYQTTTYINDSRAYRGAVVGSTFLYTRNQTAYKYNLATSSHSVLCTSPSGTKFSGAPSVDGNGEWLFTSWYDADNRSRTIAKINSSTGAVTTLVTPAEIQSLFDLPYDYLDHIIVSPVDDDLIFFCHNGPSTEIDDRLWVYDADLDQFCNVFLQSYTGGSLGEYVGHESWMSDGERLLFVKYSASPIKPTGVMTCDNWGADYEYINSDESYLHAASSPDRRWAVADVTHYGNPRHSDVYLIDLQTYKSKHLANVRVWDNHPGHVHPCFGPDSETVTFTCADDNDYLWVGCMDISDIGEIKSRSLASVVLAQTVQEDGIDFRLVTNPAEEGYTTVATMGGIECRCISSNKKMYFNVDDDFITEADDCADIAETVEIRYYDTGTDYLRLDYNADTEYYRAYYVAKTNTNTWKTATIVLTDTWFRNGQNWGNDFRIHNNGDGAEYVSSVKVYRTGGAVLADTVDEDGVDFYLTTDPASEGYTTVATIGGRTCRRITSNKKMYFDVEQAYVTRSDRTVCVAFDYYDTGTDQLRLQYNSVTDAYQTLYLTKSNTNTWKTALFELDDADFREVQNLGHDFRIHLNGDGDEYISSVAVYVKGASAVLGTTVDEKAMTFRLVTDPCEEGYTVATTIGSRPCRSISSNKKMYFDVKDEYVRRGDRNVTIAFDYYDDGTDDILLQYNSVNQAYQARYITKTNTDRWKTAVVVLDNAEFNDQQNWGNDFRLHTNSDGTGTEYISDVQVYLSGR